MKNRVLASLWVGLLSLPALPVLGDTPPDRMPQFAEEIYVLGEEPFIEPVELGQPVSIVFGVGELQIEVSDVSEVRAVIELKCRKLSTQRCAGFRKRLRVEPRRTEDGLEVRMVGLSRRRLGRLGVRGRIPVPRWSPMRVRVGIGDVDIHTGNKDLSVRMGIGDLTIHAPKSEIGSVVMKTRIGDASVRQSGKRTEGKRRMLIGARIHWLEGAGSSHIAVGLRIGDARVILE